MLKFLPWFSLFQTVLLQTVSIEHLRSLHAKVRELLVLYQTEFEADVVIDTTISALQVPTIACVFEIFLM